MASRLLILGLAAAVAGCAAGAGSPVDQPEPVVGIERGQALARQRCGVCHALGPSGDSAQPMAPPFRAMGGRFNPISLERRMVELDLRGHGEMPPVRLAADEARDVAAYIASLETP